MLVADCLSRNYPPDDRNPQRNEDQEHIFTVFKELKKKDDLPVSSETYQLIETATDKCT